MPEEKNNPQSEPNNVENPEEESGLEDIDLEDLELDEDTLNEDEVPIDEGTGVGGDPGPEAEEETIDLETGDGDETPPPQPTPTCWFPWILPAGMTVMLLASLVYISWPTSHTTASVSLAEKQLSQLASDIASATEAITAQADAADKKFATFREQIVSIVDAKIASASEAITDVADQRIRIDMIGGRLTAAEDFKDRVADIAADQQVLSASVSAVEKRQDEFDKVLTGIRGETRETRDTTNQLSRMLVETRVLARFAAGNVDAIHIGNFAIGQTVIKTRMAEKIALINQARAAGEVEVVAVWAGADADTGTTDKNQGLSNNRSWAIGISLNLGDSKNPNELKASQVGVGGLKYKEVAAEDQRAGYVFIRFLKPSDLMLKLGKI